MTIVTSEVVINRENGSDLNRRIRELHTDHIGGEAVYTYDALFNLSGNIVDSEATILYATLADKTAENAIKTEDDLAAKEIQHWIDDMGQGLDPWHSAPYVNVTPEFNDWETAASESLKYWLVMPDRQQLLNCDLSANSTSNGDLTDLLDLCGSSFSSSDLRGEIQMANNTQDELDTYVPSVV